MQRFTVPEEFDLSREYEVTFWAKNDTNKNQTAIYEKAIEDFENLYPNITVNLRLYTDYGKIYNDVITNIATNTTPNVCITYPDHIATYLTGGNLVVPLDELFVDGRYGAGGSEVRFDAPRAEEIIPQFLEECSFGGHYYAMPYMRSTEACYVNKTYVEAMGYTLPETLFAQYLLTNEVQIAYSETEGYVPVTSKAQESEEYRAYLKACGEDEAHYEVKIKAADLLLTHMEDTFVTPVFNGSASLRDAAGQMIETTVKSVRRKQTVDGAYIEKLYADMSSLYRLDQIERQNGMSSGRDDLGKLPRTAVILLVSLAGVWGLILLYVAAGFLGKKKR